MQIHALFYRFFNFAFYFYSRCVLGIILYIYVDGELFHRLFSYASRLLCISYTLPSGMLSRHIGRQQMVGPPYVWPTGVLWLGLELSVRWDYVRVVLCCEAQRWVMI